MFKELKLIKLLVFVGLLLAIILNMNFSNLLIKEVYTDKPSYYSGEVVKVYTSTDFIMPYSHEMEITDCSDSVVGMFEAEITNQKSNNDSLFSNGLSFEKFIEYQLPNNLKSGVYFINKQYPLIVKAKEKYEITIVYPFANNVLYQPFENKTVFSENIENASLLRTVPMDKYSEGLKKLFVDLNANYSVNYVADIDLEMGSNFDSSSLLIIYGKSSCWTPKMKNSMENYIKTGGNVLLITSYTLNNICWYNSEQQKITMFNPDSIAMSSWQNYDTVNYKNIIGVSYTNGGYSVENHYKIADSKHTILNGIADDKIKFNADLYNSPPIKWYDDLPEIDLEALGFYKGEIIAYHNAAYHKNDKGIKGIFVLQPDSTSGKIVSLGTEDWCIKENYQDKKELQIITKNAIEYLLK